MKTLLKWCRIITARFLFIFVKGAVERMKYMGVNEIRKSYLNFFEKKGHLARKSFSLVPENDKSLLLINAGMTPMKNYFIGVETPPSKRMVTCQKCMRTGDIDNVGRTARHATFFEMLGNFSFGDYFKKEATQWAWEFVTQELGLSKEDLWVTVYEEDDQAAEFWEKNVGVSREKIVRLGKADNFWEIGNGTGPCGPCSELYIDRGAAFGCQDPNCKPGCECDRFLEFWNLVFTQFDQDEQGNYNPLPNPNIDTGMGLERMACIMQGVDSIFDIDTMKNIRDHVCKISGKTYNQDKSEDISIRVITDHVRAVTFLISDGVLPSNEGRGYVLRRILRRAARHGKLIGIQGSFLVDLVDTVIDNYGGAYEELLEKQDYIKKIVSIEETKFAETLEQGLSILLSYIEEIKSRGESVLSGEQAFRLYDTYGFPIELTVEILEENAMTVDGDGFDVQMKVQKERARTARAEQGVEGWKEDGANLQIETEKTLFEGYDTLSISGQLEAIVMEGNLVERIGKGEKGIFILDKTPFYAESGGQIGDRGQVEAGTFKAVVHDVKKNAAGQFLHHIEVLKGEATVGMQLNLLVSQKIRRATQRNHTATHLLHKVLREVVGTHIAQAGSLVSDKRLRFDFNHFEPLTEEQFEQIETLVNEAIFASIPVYANQMSLEEAKRLGAMALFDEKYEDRVRVISVGDFSMELCGGTHVNNSSEIGMFKIISESGIAAGVRRIEAITGDNVYRYLLERETVIKEAKLLLKSNEDYFIPRLKSVLEEHRLTLRELSALKNEMAKSKTESLLSGAVDVNGVQYIRAIFDHMDEDTMRTMAENLMTEVENSVVMLCNRSEEKLSFVCMVSPIALQKGVHAGKFIKEVASITGGGGGGRPNMAQAGGKEPSKAEEAMSQSEDILKRQLAKG